MSQAFIFQHSTFRLYSLYVSYEYKLIPDDFCLHHTSSIAATNFTHAHTHARNN